MRSQTCPLEHDTVPVLRRGMIPYGTDQMAIGIARREFISVLGGAAAIWPLATRAQQPAMPVIGFLTSGSAGPMAYLVPAFRAGLGETGFTEGRNVAIEYRWADNQYDRLPALASDLVSRKVAVIAAVGGPASGLAVKATNTSIPFVFVSGTDPVKLGLVASFNRPGGNATGVNILSTAIDAKRFGLLHELVPAATKFACLVNPNSPETDAQISNVQEAARAIGSEVRFFKASAEREIDEAFTAIAQFKPDALLVSGDPILNFQRAQIIPLVARNALPAIYEGRAFAEAGGLMSYGPSLTEIYRQVGTYVGLILKGKKPADLPIVQPTVLELIINLKTAKMLGIEIPPALLARADDVIE
jgi:putative ABC transport system substrate-binding protein